MFNSMTSASFNTNTGKLANEFVLTIAIKQSNNLTVEKSEEKKSEKKSKSTYYDRNKFRIKAQNLEKKMMTETDPLKKAILQAQINDARHRHSVSSAESSFSDSDDSTKTKRHHNPFLSFCTVTREQLKKTEPTLKGKDVLRRMAEMWKVLPENQKAVYKNEFSKVMSGNSEQSSNESNTHHETPIELKQSPVEITTLNTSDDCKESLVESTTHSSTDDCEDDPVEPTIKKCKSNCSKRPLNPFLRFCKVTRKQLKETDPTLKGVDILRRMAEMWNGLPENQKAVYIEAYQNEIKTGISGKSEQSDTRHETPRSPVEITTLDTSDDESITHSFTDDYEDVPVVSSTPTDNYKQAPDVPSTPLPDDYDYEQVPNETELTVPNSDFYAKNYWDFFNLLKLSRQELIDKYEQTGLVRFHYKGMNKRELAHIILMHRNGLYKN